MKSLALGALINRSILIAMLAIAPLMVTAGCAEQDTSDPVVKTTRLDESRQDSIKKQRQQHKPKIQSFGKHEPVDI